MGVSKLSIARGKTLHCRRLDLIGVSCHGKQRFRRGARANLHFVGCHTNLPSLMHNAPGLRFLCWCWCGFIVSPSIDYKSIFPGKNTSIYAGFHVMSIARWSTAL